MIRKPIHLPTKEEIEEIRKQDAVRCKNYLTAKDFYEKYGDNENEYLVYLSRKDIIRVNNIASNPCWVVLAAQESYNA